MAGQEPENPRWVTQWERDEIRKSRKEKLAMVNEMVSAGKYSLTSSPGNYTSYPVRKPYFIPSEKKSKRRGHGKEQDGLYGL